jgi:hypothetical protein
LIPTYEADGDDSPTPQQEDELTSSSQPSDMPSYLPSEAPTEETDPPSVTMESDNNVTTTTNTTTDVDDEIDLENMPDVNVTESSAQSNTTDDEDDDFVMIDESQSPTSAPSTNKPTESPTTSATETQVVEDDEEDVTEEVNNDGGETDEEEDEKEDENENNEDMLPCYWRFLTGGECTNKVNGDVVNAHHHQFLVSDGQCHYHDFFGYYRALCAAAHPDSGDHARIFLQHVFCSNSTCSSCLQNGVIRPELYTSHSCNYLHFPVSSSNSVEFDLAFEFVGGCFENEVCSRITIAGEGSSR